MTMKRLILLVLAFLLLAAPAAFAASAPGAPGNATFTGITGTGFTASWTTASQTPTGYFLDYALNNTFTSGLNTLTLGAVLTTPVTGLTNNTTYYVRVRAKNATGTGPNNTTTSVTTLALPAAPASGVATAINSSGFTANWGAVAGATGYSIDVGTTSGGTQTLSNSSVGVGTSSAITGLAPSTTYWYQVRVTTAGGTSVSSTPVSLTTLPNPPAAPTVGVATGITSTGFTANWSASTGATGYFLDVSTSATFASFVYNNMSVSGTSQVITGLSAGTTYYFRVAATNAGGTSAESTTATLTTAPGTPTATAANPITTTGFTANWNAVAGATSYVLDVGTTSGGTDIINGTNVGNGISSAVTGLASATTYYYRIRALNSGGPSSNSNVITVLTATPVPAAPVATAGNPITTTGFTANWGAVPGATGYFIDVSLSSTFASFVLSNVSVGNGVSSAVTGLSSATTYYYRVRGSNVGGAGANSNVITVLTATPIPGAPTATAAGTITTTGFTANWTAPSGPITGYYLDLATDAGFSSLVASFNPLTVASVSNVTITGLASSTTYYYRVRAYNAGGTGINSNAITVLTATPPPAVPVATAASAITTTGFTANWNPSAGAVTYNLDVSLNSSFSSFVGTYHNLSVAGITQTVTGLSPTTPYYYRVSAVNVGGTSSPSNTINPTTATPLPSAPTANAATVITTTGLTANWSAPVTGPVSGYYLDLALDNGFTSFLAGYNPLPLAGTITSQALTSLPSGTALYYRVRAWNATGTGPNSGTITATTLTPIPAAPSAGAATLVSTTGFTANWTAPSGTVSGYYLDVSLNSGFTSFVGSYSSMAVAGTSQAVTGLSIGTTYYYRVRAWNVGGTGVSSSTITTLTLTPIPATPVATAATALAVGSFTANWTASTTGPVTGYYLDVATDSAFTSLVSGYSALSVGNVVTKSVSGLASGMPYYYRVSAYNVGGVSPVSNVITATTTLTAPVASAATAVTAGGFTANWNPSAGAYGYYLDVATDSGFVSMLAGYSNLDVGNVATKAVVGSPGVPYYYRVRAYTPSVTTVSSNTISVTTVPAAVVANAATSFTLTGFTANWTAPSGTVTGYYLDVSTDNAFGSFVSGYNNLQITSGTSKAVTGLSNLTTYYYRVRAYNGSGTGANSNTVTAITVPVAPVATAATSFTSVGFTVNWNPVPGASGYFLDVGTSSGGAQLISNANAGSATTAIISSASPGTTYYYQVRAYNAALTPSANSNVITAVMIPGAPATVVATNRTQNSFQLNWTAAPGTVTGYYLDVATDAAFTNMLAGYPLTLGVVTQYTVTGVSVGTDYYYRVRAFNNNGTGANSNVLIADTAPAVLGITAGTSSSDPNPVDLTLSTLGGPYVKTLNPFIKVNFSEQVLGIAYGATPSIKMTYLGGSPLAPVQVAVATPYDPKDSSTLTAAGSPSTASFQPASGLSNSVQYTITISGGTSANLVHDTVGAGTALTSAGPFYLTVDTIAPTVASIVPASNATGVGLSQAITVVFNENCVMDNRTYNSLNVQLTDTNGNLVTTTISGGSSPFKTLTVTPAVAMDFNSLYTLTLSNIKDAAGNLLNGTGTFTSSFTTRAASVSSYSMNPAFISNTVVPNVLIILDNSNSMDETLATGDAVGSFNCTDPSDPNSCSRSVLARQALINLVNTYAGKINIGLMSYNLPSDTSKSYYLYNNYYFASYDQRTYCGITPPPQACYNYCVNEDAASMTACNSACQGTDPAFQGLGYTFNPLFQANIKEPIITSVTNGSAVGSAKRMSYCANIYPKTTYHYEPAPNNVKVYHSIPGTFYSGSASEGIRFLYAGKPPGNANYDPSDGAVATYYSYLNKTGQADGYTGYTNFDKTWTFGPTEDDIALGFANYGQAGMWYPPNAGAAAKTWFSTSAASPAGGFLHVPVAINGSDNVQLNKLLAKIGPQAFKNDQTGYMACGSTGSSANRCSYIVNAGPTPTAGTLQSAMDYFNGVLAAAQTQDNAKPASPIQYNCQKNFIIYVTDGLPSVDASGNKGNATTLTPAVLAKINSLRCPAGSTVCGVSQTIGGVKYNFDVQTYVLGLAITPQSSGILDSMAVAGGADNAGHAYYANDAASLNNSLVQIFQNIFSRLSSGAAASILNNSEGSGALLLQALFYPDKTFANNTSVKWTGELLNLWYFVDPFFNLSTIHEDSDSNHVMDTAVDKRVEFYFDTASKQTKINRYNLDGVTIQNSDADLDGDVSGGLKTLWSAGKLLWRRDLTADPRNIYTTLNGSNLTGFNDANAASLVPDLQVTGTDAASRQTSAQRIIDYVNGTDVCLDTSSPCSNSSRNRTVTMQVSADPKNTETHVYKLGDIISSTPKLQGSLPLQAYDQAGPIGYNDSSYKAFYSTQNYQNRGMVYVGSNDGMLHAFKLGKMTVKTLGTQRATLTGNNLGREEWAFVPQNVLPYLSYLMDPVYEKNHLYLMDGTNVLFDVATKTTSGRSDYWNEDRSVSSWNTVLLGGMGIGGASKNLDNNCVDSVDTGTCVKTPMNNLGYSSYFALDVTNQDFDPSSNLLRAQPTLKWEFSNPQLGYATSGPALIRLNAKDTVPPNSPLAGKNGRWFAVYASGPTGPINTGTQAFKGKSDQNLKLFVVDVEKGPVISADPKANGLWIIDTGIANAFGGNISNNAVVDAEIAFNPNDPNVRQDDVLYVGYTKMASDGTWTDGGVLRLTIPDSANPDNMDVSAWKTSRVIDGIGPVTTAVSKLQSQNNLYLFFGTGRYFYPQDDMSSTRSIFMVKDKCYPVYDGSGKLLKSDIIDGCSESTTSVLGKGDLTSENTPSAAAVANGWFIDLDAGERIVTDTVSTVNGSVFFTSYKPTADVCGLGGKSYLWGVKYDTGGTLPSQALKGKVLIQLSTGSFAEMNLGTALTDKTGRRTGEASNLTYGKASADAGLFMTAAGLAPVKRILHIQERFK